MKIVNGNYSSAKIFTDDVEDYALVQIKQICDNQSSKDSIIRIMPDVHPGKVGPIGLTMTITDSILPNIVGIDIGCGVSTFTLKQKKIEYQKLDSVIRENIPSGFSIRNKPHIFAEDFPFEDLKCFKNINLDKTKLSMGSLGGGNHFIEIDQSDNKTLYLTIHSGSRSLGKAVTEYYLNKGQILLKEQCIEVPYELTYLTGDLMKEYLHDVRIVQQFATFNRLSIKDEIVKNMNLKVIGYISCIHNYIDEDNILRKGAISARKNEDVIIPINMRDGVILGTGNGNKDWNYSAPHGAGRILKREDVKNHYTVSSFKKEMKGIYSSCINKETLDEAPFAYRGIDEISNLIKDTVTINEILKPVYNYKAGSK